MVRCLGNKPKVEKQTSAGTEKRVIPVQNDGNEVFFQIATVLSNVLVS